MLLRATPSRNRGTAEMLGRLVTSCAVIALGARAASTGVSKWEERLFKRMNSGPARLEPVLWAPMQFGSLWGPVVVGAGLWRLARNPRMAVGIFATGLVSWQLAKVVKNQVKRGRPFHELDEISHRMGTPYDGLGYVSGHTAVAAAMTTALWPSLTRRGRVLATVLTALVAYGRINVSAHLPVDLVGGAALGVAVGTGWQMANGKDNATAEN